KANGSAAILRNLVRKATGSAAIRSAKASVSVSTMWCRRAVAPSMRSALPKSIPRSSSTAPQPAPAVPTCMSGGGWDRGLEVLDVGLFGADGFGGFAEVGKFGVGEWSLNHPTYALAAQFGGDAEVDAGDAVLAVHPGADRPHGTGVGVHVAHHAGSRGRRRVVRRAG